MKNDFTNVINQKIQNKGINCIFKISIIHFIDIKYIILRYKILKYIYISSMF